MNNEAARVLATCLSNGTVTLTTPRPNHPLTLQRRDNEAIFYWSITMGPSYLAIWLQQQHQKV